MTLQAAIGRVDYTPEAGVPFGRMSHHTLLAQGVHSPLSARLALLSDGRTTLGVLALDQIRNRRVETLALRRALGRALGVPPDHFLVCATHTHNSPGLSPWRPNDTGFQLLDPLCERVAALAARLKTEWRPARLHWAEAQAPGCIHNRRSVYRMPDGREQVGTHGSRQEPDFLCVEGDDENQLRLLRILSEDGQPIGGFVHVACHPTTMYGVPLFSSDYPGVVRDRLEAELGGTFLFLTGLAGDQSPCLPPGTKADTPEDVCRLLGEALATAAGCAAGSAQPVPVKRGLAVARRQARLALRLPTPGQVVVAWEHLEAVLRGERPGPLCTRLYGHAYHFHHGNPVIDDWLAREIIGRWELLRRGEERHPSEAVEIQVLRIGEAALAGFPGEPFACFGRRLREESVLPLVLGIEHANGFAGYLPPPEAFAHGGYECCLADQSRFEPQAGPRLTRAALALLRRLA